MKTDARYTTKSRPFILGYRIILALMGGSTLLVSHILSSTYPDNVSLTLIERNIRIYRYFTNQTNLLVIIWLVLAIIWSSDPDKMQKLMGKVKGAITLYITVTFIIFAIVLSPLYHPSGIEGIINLMLHYIIPVAFIVDWIITEGTGYEWKFIPYWLVYPICYLVFALFHGATTGDYIYPFVNYEVLGFSGLVISVTLLIFFFIGLSSLYIAVSRKLLPIKQFFT
ncbi:MAG: Pr6Pr family membrane protein [Candidatus Hodarchaeales archaeon]